MTSLIVISLLQFGQISIVGTTEHASLVLMTFPFARRNVGASEKAHPGLGACQSEKQELRTGPVALRQRLDRQYCAPIIRKSRGKRPLKRTCGKSSFGLPSGPENRYHSRGLEAKIFKGELR